MRLLLRCVLLGSLIITLCDLICGNSILNDAKKNKENKNTATSKHDEINLHGNENKNVKADKRVYLFGYGYSWGLYEYLNADNELLGLGYNIVRSVCRIMNKRCEHAVYYDYSLVWDSHGKSRALNSRWFDVAVSWIQTKKRKSAYSFFGEYAKEPPSYMYTRINNTQLTVQELAYNISSKVGFRSGFGNDHDDKRCLENYLGASLGNRAVLYTDHLSSQEALIQGEVEVAFMRELEVQNHAALRRVGDAPIRCAMGGVSMMTRKDEARNYLWFDEGLLRLRSQDYRVLCDLAARDGDPRCLDD